MIPRLCCPLFAVLMAAYDCLAAPPALRAAAPFTFNISSTHPNTVERNSSANTQPYSAAAGRVYVNR